ncbi:MAG TPA: hypothetical protein VKZ60_09370, partial [Chloroflexota bacterium]|nr:hypothetical protein [Chloroflexota bacterium]
KQRMARLTRRAALLAALIALSALAPGAGAAPGGQGGDATAPPPSLCPDALNCTYLERRPVAPEVVWRFQSLSICGANCSERYWVTDTSTGRVALSTPEVRGGGIVAVARTNGTTPRPAVRVILPDPEPTDAGCCPSYYRDTIYRWDPAQGRLVVDQSRRDPTTDFPGWDALRRALDAEQFDIIFGD